MESYKDFLLEIVELVVMVIFILISNYIVIEAFAGDDFKQILDELIQWF